MLVVVPSDESLGCVLLCDCGRSCFVVCQIHFSLMVQGLVILLVE